MAEHVIGRYVIGDLVGTGPLGKVYAATDKETGQLVVFRGFVRPKIVDTEHWRQAEERYKRELEAAQKLDHPHIGKIIEFGDGGTDELYHVATEWFVGKNLKQLLDEHGPMSPDQLRPLLEQAASAVDYAAQQGLSHGDLSLFNVLVTGDGHVKIINYGLGHCRNKLGSPFLAEQLTGFSGDWKSDIYALGAIAYELLAGQPLFTGTDAHEVARKIHGALPPQIPGLDEWADHVVDRMLAKNPAERYASAAEAVADFHARRKPVGHVHQTHRQWEPPPPWEADQYRPPPSLADFQLHDSDVRELRHRRHHQAGLADLQRRRVIGWLRNAAVAAVFVLGMRDLLTLPDRARSADVVNAAGSPKRYDVRRGALADLKRSETVLGSETIATGPSDSVTLEFFDGARVKVQPNSLVSLDELDYKPRKGQSVRELMLWYGEVWVRARPFRSGSTFIIVSSNASARLAGSRETVLRVQANRTGTIVANLRGEVSLARAAARVSRLHRTGVLVAAAGPQFFLVADASATGQSISEGSALQALGNAINQLPLDDKTKSELANHPDLTKAASALESLRLLVSGLEEGLMPPISAIANTIGLLNPAKTIDDATAMAKAMTAIQAITKSMQMDFMDSNRYPAQINLKTLEGAGMSAEAVERVLRCFEGGALKSYKLHAPDDFEFTAIAKDSKKTVLVCRKGVVKSVKEEE